MPYLALDGSAHDELRALVEAELKVLPDVLRELSEELSEQTGKQSSRQVKPLLTCSRIQDLGLGFRIRI